MANPPTHTIDRCPFSTPSLSSPQSTKTGVEHTSDKERREAIQQNVDADKVGNDKERIDDPWVAVP